MQSENLNETFLKKTRKAKERFQRQKEKKYSIDPTKSQEQESQKRYTTKQKKKEPRTQIKARKAPYRQSIKLFYLI